MHSCIMYVCAYVICMYVQCTWSEATKLSIIGSYMPYYMNFLPSVRYLRFVCSSSDSWAGFHVGRIPRQGTLVQTKSNILSCWQCSCVFRVVSSSRSRRETTSCLPQCQCLRIKYISKHLLSHYVRESTKVLDSGSQSLDSGSQYLDSGFQPFGFRIPTFWIPDSIPK